MDGNEDSIWNLQPSCSAPAHLTQHSSASVTMAPQFLIFAELLVSLLHLALILFFPDQSAEIGGLIQSQHEIPPSLWSIPLLFIIFGIL